jgi:hypothetical protein
MFFCWLRPSVGQEDPQAPNELDGLAVSLELATKEVLHFCEHVRGQQTKLTPELDTPALCHVPRCCLCFTVQVKGDCSISFVRGKKKTFYELALTATFALVVEEPAAVVDDEAPTAAPQSGTTPRASVLWKGRLVLPCLDEDPNTDVQVSDLQEASPSTAHSQLATQSQVARVVQAATQRLLASFRDELRRQ